MKILLGKRLAALLTVTLAAVGGKAWGAGSAQALGSQSIEQRVAAVRAKAAELARAAPVDQRLEEQQRTRLAESWKKWKNE